MLSLIAMLALLMPMLSLSVQSRNLFDPFKKLAAVPAQPVAPVITATKTDALLVDNDADGNADTGDTLKYTVTITNNGGGDATGVQFNDTPDANTTLVPGSVTTTPVAVNDTYAASGNIQISFNAANGVLANDNDADGNTVTASAGATSTQGGNVTMNADGSFTYNPPAGFEGTDTFTYSITDGTTTDSATVSITVSGMIWFVDNTAASGGDGRLTSPFNALTGAGSFDAVAADDPGDNIFLYTGSGSYNGGLTLKASQRLIGQGAGNTLSAITGVNPPSGSLALPATGGTNPTIVSATNGVNLGTNNVIRGLDIGNRTGQGLAGSGFGLLTVREVNITGNGQALSLNTGVLDAIFGGVASTNSSGTGISLLSVSGTLVSGPTNIQNPATVGIQVSSSDANLSFGNTAVVGSGGTGVNLQSNIGNISFGDLSILPDGGQRGLFANANSIGTIASTSGGISTTGARAVEVDGVSAVILTNLGLTLTSVSASADANGILLTNTSGNFTVTGDGSGLANGSGGTIQGMASDGVQLTNVTNVSLTGMNIQTNLNNGINGTSVNGFILDNSNVTNNGDAVNESGVKLTNLSGTAIAGTNPTRIKNTTVSGSAQNNVTILNTASTLTDLLVKNSTFKTPAATFGADGFNVETQNSATATVRLEGNTFQSNFTQGFQGQASNSSTLTVNATLSNTFQNNNEGIVLSISNDADLNFDIENNTFTGQLGTSIFVGTSTTATSNADLRGKIISNNVNTPAGGVNHSVFTLPSGNSNAVIKIDSNTIVNNAGLRGINVTDADVAGAATKLDVTVTNNNVTVTTPDAIYVEGRNNATVCAKIENNTASSSTFGINLRRRDASVVNLEKGVSASSVALQVLKDNNPAIPPAQIRVQTGTPTVVNNGTCNMVAMLFPDVSPNYLAKVTTAKDSGRDKRANSAPNAVALRSKNASSSKSVTQAARPVKAERNTAMKNHATLSKPAINMAGSISLNLGTLPAGKSVTITFQVTINNSVPPGTTQVSNQGVVSGSNFANVLTDDPDAGGTADPTVTPIQSTTPPTISCPAPITVNADSGTCSKSVSFNVTATGTPAPTVDCKIGATSITSPHTFPVGTTTVQCTASNGIPPDDSCSFTVTVNDVDAPVITVNGANPMTVECHTTFTDPGATANDLCAGSVAVTSSGTVDANTPGTYTITYSATDGTNTATATRTVNVVDTTAPVITLNGANPMTVECHTGFSDPGATASDACAGTVPVTASGAVDANTPGTYTITYSASDNAGHTTTTTRTVNVVDTLAPVITINGANPFTVECHTSFTDPGATASDSCAGSVAVTSTNNVNVNVPGAYTVTYMASDGTNTATATRTVNVVDTIAPVITVNGANPLTVECHTSLNDPGATATDSCAGTVAVNSTDNVNVNVPGSYTITYTATDGTNSSTATRTVNVVDTTAPVITLNGADPMTVECHTSFSDPGATANDSCAGSVAVTSTNNVNANVPGSYSVTYSATDGYNTTTRTRTVNVVDTIAPVITMSGANPMSVECHTSFTDPGATATDSCAGAVAVNSTNNVNVNVPGSYTVTYTATDGFNTATATRTVNVVDTIPPTLTLNGANPMTVECHTGFSDPGATASDSCAGNLTSSIVVTGSVNPNAVGTYTLTYSVSDGSHTTTRTRTVNVVDTIAPVITMNGANPMTVNCHSGFTDPGATANDSCAGNVPVSSASNVNPNAPGTYHITYTATDGYNTSTATRTVIVVDSGLPTITLNNQAHEMWPPNHKYETFNLTDFVVSASDGCDTSININNVVISKVTSDETENGNGDGNTLNDIVIAANCKSVQLRSERDGGGDGRVYTITFRVKDATGNVATATAKVTVPKSQGSGAAIDSGVHYTVNGTCP